MIINIFNKTNYLKTANPIISSMALSIMKHKHQIETWDDLVFSYLMPRGLSA